MIDIRLEAGALRRSCANLRSQSATLPCSQVVIVAPSRLCDSWVAKAEKWLGDERIQVHDFCDRACPPSLNLQVVPMWVCSLPLCLFRISPCVDCIVRRSTGSEMTFNAAVDGHRARAPAGSGEPRTQSRLCFTGLHGAALHDLAHKTRLPPPAIPPPCDPPDKLHDRFVQDFVFGTANKACVMAYETVHKFARELKGSCDLLVCDEGHRCGRAEAQFGVARTRFRGPSSEPRPGFRLDHDHRGLCDCLVAILDPDCRSSLQPRVGARRRDDRRADGARLPATHPAVR